MKKSNLIEGIVTLVIGIVCLAALLLTDSKLEGMFSFFAGYGIILGIRKVRKYAYWNAPENRERRDEYLEAAAIEDQDERTLKIRDRAGRHTYTLSLYLISLAIFGFGTLDKLEILADGHVFVLFLGLLLIALVIAERIIRRYVERRN